MKSHSIPIAVLLAALAQPAVAQQKTHKWIDGLCEYSVRFDPRKIDPRDLAATTNLLSSEASTVPHPPFMSIPADIAKHDPETFARDCKAQAEKARADRPLPLAGLEDLKAERLRQLDDACVFGTTYMKGYRDASALRGYAPASPHCDAFVDALEGKSDMVAFFRQRLDENCRSNASPAICRERYESQARGPNGNAAIKLYLTSFGWGNCATRYTAVNTGSDRLTAMRETGLKTLRRAYRVKETCEDP